MVKCNFIQQKYFKNQCESFFTEIQNNYFDCGFLGNILQSDAIRHVLCNPIPTVGEYRKRCHFNMDTRKNEIVKV